jgi:hypothetical protein
MAHNCNAWNGYRCQPDFTDQHGGFGHRNSDLQCGSILAVRTPDPDLCGHHHADGHKEH